MAGEVFDVAVDVRKSSPTFGKWVGYCLSAENKRQLWVPADFAHGFLVTSDSAEFAYKCTEYYHPESEVSVRWDDQELGIEWPVEKVQQMLLSEQDKTVYHLDLMSACDPVPFSSHDNALVFLSSLVLFMRYPA